MIKRFLKKIGRVFIVLKQREEDNIRQKVLLVDGNFILPNNSALIIRRVKDKFTNANLTILTFQDKKEFLNSIFPEIVITIPGTRIKTKRYPLAIQLLQLLLCRKFDLIVLSSLDISTVLVSLFCSKSLILLHNRWFEWYQMRFRTIGDVLRRVKSADKNRRRVNKGIKDIVKSLGRIFVLLTETTEESIKCRILVEDNGYTEIGHVLTAVRRAEEIFINPDITILTFTERKQHFINTFPQTKIVIAEANNRHRLAIQIYRMRKHRFNCIVLTTLDISPIIVSFLFFRPNVLLYNRWHQWWSLEFRNIWGYLKEILSFLVMIPVLIYLFITVSAILLRTHFRLGLINIKSIAAKKK